MFFFFSCNIHTRCDHRTLLALNQHHAASTITTSDTLCSRHDVICCCSVDGQPAHTVATHNADPGQAACRATLRIQERMEV